MQLFGTKEQKFLHCPGTKGQQDKLKILPLEGTGRDSVSKSLTGCGTGKDRLSKSGTVTPCVPSWILTGCPGPSRPLARFLACPVVPLSRDNERTFVPLPRKVALSRPIGNPNFSYLINGLLKLGDSSFIIFESP